MRYIVPVFGQDLRNVPRLGLLQQQLAFEPMYFSFPEKVLIFICSSQRFRQST